jgi:ABC-type Zn2+ transport system substrate-binding protein/surface adhesin
MAHLFWMILIMKVFEVRIQLVKKAEAWFPFDCREELSVLTGAPRHHSHHHNHHTYDHQHHQPHQHRRHHHDHDHHHHHHVIITITITITITIILTSNIFGRISSTV